MSSVAPFGSAAAIRDRGAVLSNSSLVKFAALLFMAPNALFASTFNLWMAAPIWLGCAVAVFIVWRAPFMEGRLAGAPIDLPLLAGSLALGLSLCLLGGEGHFFYANSDWLMRDAVLSDLVSRGFSIGYHEGGVDYFLRAPLGMYALPAIVGQHWGLRAAHLAMLGQNALLLSGVLYFTGLLASGRRTLFVALVIGFSGLEILVAGLATISELLHNGQFLTLWQIDSWVEIFEYCNFVMLVFWAPNHALPAWWLTLLVLLGARRDCDLAIFISIASLILFWSPFALIGVAPFAAIWALEQLKSGEAFNRRTLLAIAGGLCLLPIALYLTRDSGTVPRGLLIGETGFFLIYALFIIVEIPHVAVLLTDWSRIDLARRRFVPLAIAMLLAFPFFKMGHFNDLATRGSIPALLILACAFADFVLATSPLSPRSRLAVTAIVLLSAPTVAFELRRAMIVPPYQISDCNLLTASAKAQPVAFPTNYFARREAIPNWMRAPQGADLVKQQRMCWPDHPLVEDARK